MGPRRWPRRTLVQRLVCCRRGLVNKSAPGLQRCYSVVAACISPMACPCPLAVLAVLCPSSVQSAASWPCLARWAETEERRRASQSS